MRRSILKITIAAEIALYTAFLIGDLTLAYDTTWLKYAAICLIALAALLNCAPGDRNLMAAALCLTALADLFLLVLDRQYALGILLFVIVQLLYALRLTRLHNGSPQRASLIRSPALLIFLAVWLSVDLTSALAAGYITLFAVNLLHAVRCAAASRDRCTILFALGLGLFFCCDLCVGLFQISSGAVWSFARVGMWAFYLPGQILILCSAFETKGETQ